MDGLEQALKSKYDYLMQQIKESNFSFEVKMELRREATKTLDQLRNLKQQINV